MCVCVCARARALVDEERTLHCANTMATEKNSKVCHNLKTKKQKKLPPHGPHHTHVLLQVYIVHVNVVISGTIVDSDVRTVIIHTLN